MPLSPTHPSAPGKRRFATTRWSLILQARSAEGQPAREALDELIRCYWLPVYAFMRQQTRDIHLAQDWTQGLFTNLLATRALTDVNPQRGRFRSFLLAAARHYVSNERDREQAAKRGGDVNHLPMDFDFEEGECQLQNSLMHHVTAEAIFERQWALTLLHRVMNRLCDLYVDAGSRLLFEALSPAMNFDAGSSSLKDIAEKLLMSEEALRVALHRMRKRYRQLLRDEISQTTESSDDVDDELRHLLSVVSNQPRK